MFSRAGDTHASGNRSVNTTSLYLLHASRQFSRSKEANIHNIHDAAPWSMRRVNRNRSPFVDPPNNSGPPYDCHTTSRHCGGLGLQRDAVRKTFAARPARAAPHNVSN